MDLNSILMIVQDKIPKNRDSINALKEQLDKLNESQKENVAFKISFLGLKNPVPVFWVGSFLFGVFGVGRFMIGDAGLGILRLIAFIGCPILSFIGFFAYILSTPDGVLGSDTYSKLFTAFGIFLLIVSALLALTTALWWFIDLFLVGKKVRKKNYDALMELISAEQKK
ncbi:MULTISPECIES: TM2 domain-containing protein [unclassified Helicobacter]|uniref:TM2 domain-containing protein n=1 Tax=unclassified Helicobacter TaxID=2593540 RepID=UPI0015F16E4A|nr:MULTISPECIES: TM2 domain-containing protein [unclassified Helicobacter]